MGILENGEIEIVGRLTEASNASLFCKINYSGQSVNAIYKPIRGERPLWDFPDGNLASREVATYLVSEALEINCVPQTIMRDGPFGVGSVQLASKSEVGTHRTNRYGRCHRDDSGEHE